MGLPGPTQGLAYRSESGQRKTTFDLNLGYLRSEIYARCVVELSFVFYIQSCPGLGMGVGLAVPDLSSTESHTCSQFSLWELSTMFNLINEGF